MRKDRNTETYSLSFLDAITCAFGAVILLLVLTKIYEPQTIERSKEEVAGLIAALQKELFDLRGETIRLNRKMKTVDDELEKSREGLAGLQDRLSGLRGEFAATQDDAMADISQRGDLAAARARLTEEMRKLLEDYEPPEADATIGGIPVDSEYIIFVIDASGSMRQYAWGGVLRTVEETLRVYPGIKGIQVIDTGGRYLWRSYARKWIPDTRTNRREIISKLRNWDLFSPSSPTQGIVEAINGFYEPGLSISLYVLGDDFADNAQVEQVASFVDRANKSDEFGNRLVRIHAVGFPVNLLGAGLTTRVVRFANLMRTLCERNGGSFIALSELEGGRGFSIRIGRAEQPGGQTDG